MFTNEELYAIINDVLSNPAYANEPFSAYPLLIARTVELAVLMNKPNTPYLY